MKIANKIFESNLGLSTYTQSQDQVFTTCTYIVVLILCHLCLPAHCAPTFLILILRRLQLVAEENLAAVATANAASLCLLAFIQINHP